MIVLIIMRMVMMMMMMLLRGVEIHYQRSPSSSLRHMRQVSGHPA